MSSASPESMQAAVEEAVSLQKAGQTDAAERLYRQVLQSCPQHSEANHNLGIISMQRGKLAEGVAHFKQALDADRDRELYRRSYARSLVLSGQGALAAKVMEEGEGPGTVPPDLDLQQRSQKANELLLRGNALTEEGNFSRAIEFFKHAIALNPELADAYHHLGSLLAETGRIAEGFDYLMKRAELAVGRGTAPLPSEPLHKTKHDREQHAYLIAQGLIPATASAADLFHVGDGARLESSALNRNGLTAAALEEWRTRDPQVVVVDDFLARPALERLRRFCADTTVWRRVYDAGYLGATPADGFACPLLAQITEEIGSVYRDILGGHPFRYLGAFKYDSELSTGTNIHADYSAINLNLYITPDDANLDPDTGGMLIWNVAARDERELRRYNSSDGEIREHLRHSQAEAMRVAHRANRAVFFKSSLFHKTDTCRFREGYLNKRINVSFLFGQFGSAPQASERLRP
jgi:tetratricopeptide (TPR) repeat protein